jgi:hypothetical protein
MQSHPGPERSGPALTDGAAEHLAGPAVEDVAQLDEGGQAEAPVGR